MLKQLFASINALNLFSVALTIGLVVPLLVQDGMFMDAMLYTSVAHNLSEGIGSFWYPQFSYLNVSELDAFHEQPPLGFGIQAVFFMLLGSSMYTERIYTGLCLLLTVWLITSIWKKINPSEAQNSWWLPIVLWIIVPITFWSFSNNMLENTMSVFLLGSVWASLTSIDSSRSKPMLALISGTLITLALLTKGLPSLFPLVVPIAYWLLFQKPRSWRPIYETVLTSLPILSTGIVLYNYAPARESLTIHIFKRLIHRITVDSTVTHYWYTLERLALEELPALIIALILFLVYRKNTAIQSIDAKWGQLFIAIGLAGTLPLMLTPIQKGFYMVPALAFFAIGIAMMIKPYAAQLDHLIARLPIVQGIAMLSLLISIGLSGFSVGKTKRHEGMLHDVYAIGKVVPTGTVIQVPRKIWDSWSLQTYFIRYFNISLDPYNKWEYYLCESARTAPNGFDKVESDSHELTLYKRNSFIETNNQ